MRKLTSTVVTGLMAFAGTAGMMAAPAHAAGELEYVALGDSYASGVGAGYYDSAGGDCKRSTLSYPAQWAAAHSDFTLKDVSCSGATIADVRANQLSALSAETDLVTLTVGGNDAQFSSVVQACLTQSDSYCKTATDWMSSYAKNQLVTELAGLYKDVKAKAPGAAIIVLGYPRTISSTGACPVIDLSPAKRTAMNGLADALAEGAQAAAAKEPTSFIDMRDTFKGHGACGSDPWINDLTDAASVFHPNLKGYMAGYAAKLNEATG
ncbi:SGNH/GDSL hydrolase family protein [Streptomyces sp. ME18-1-4]|uniref:SGNH/GDSL hydrolase family protein n=1 Tax=Streptomyces sp. ME18-1-4 TaxID=3028685 RepID=UPI0029ACEE59|nr:SGNH/GDSL hydrolase family protein [Streptomyces sp. ME18-1-4]MDX3244115.1 SGNH/GDSL hydrolase family protein [Streptomyces sp. ME18-1-4]